jgi:hypothetical protein
MPYLKNLVGQVAPQALPDLRENSLYETLSFFSDQTGRFFCPAAGLTPETYNLALAICYFGLIWVKIICGKFNGVNSEPVNAYTRRILANENLRDQPEHL